MSDDELGEKKAEAGTSGDQNPILPVDLDEPTASVSGTEAPVEGDDPEMRSIDELVAIWNYLQGVEGDLVDRLYHVQVGKLIIIALMENQERDGDDYRFPDDMVQEFISAMEMYSSAFLTASVAQSASGTLPQASGTLPQASGTLPQASGTLPQASGTLPQASGSSTPPEDSNSATVPSVVPEVRESVASLSSLDNSSSTISEVSDCTTKTSKPLVSGSDTSFSSQDSGEIMSAPNVASDIISSFDPFYTCGNRDYGSADEFQQYVKSQMGVADGKPKDKDQDPGTSSSQSANVCADMIQNNLDEHERSLTRK